MASRNYIPTLLFIMNKLCRYIQRYQMQLNENLDTGQQTLLNNLLNACIALTDDIGPLPINP